MGKVNWSVYAKFKVNKIINSGNDIENEQEEIHQIKDSMKLNSIITDSAIYYVCIEDITIPRIGKDDTDGTLCIGQAKNLERRYKQFRSGVMRASGHSEANLLYYLLYYSSSVRNKLNGKNIVVYYRMVEQAELDQQERDEIIYYIMKYGEPPVLNCAIPKRYIDWVK